MQHCYIVDTANAPWKQSATEGITFACQVLLSGEDGGPEALRFRFDDCPSVYAHMHLTSQFQLLLNGAMDFPRGVKHLEALGLHYTDHNMPYGPFAVSQGHDMLVLHPRAGGIISMANADARRKINLRGRLFVSLASQTEWQPVPGAEHTAFKYLMPPDCGPAAVVVRAPAHAALTMPAAEFGRYEVVLEGSVMMGGQEIGPPGFRYVRGEKAAEALVTGDDGASVAFLTFDKDALEGGITGEGLAVEAAEAMARAV
ncbi:MAG TPA: hypothetical protein VGO08_20680 [Burkholderiales bacterium]|jgi:hypothetical protein|nr:hypothetical protein [Burkholderiales bacterium]